MNDKTFSSILDRQSVDVERPKPLPAGTYDTMIQGMFRLDKSSKKQTEFSEYTHKITSVGEDVDENELKAYLTNADGSTKSINDVTIKNQYYHTEESLFRLKDFLKDCGIEDVDVPGNSLRSLMEQTPNCQVRIFVVHEPSQDGQSVFAKIKKTMPVE
jgi:uncharacterized protein (DUF488 family)